MTIDLRHKKMEKSGIPDFFPEKKLTHRLRALQPVSFYKSYHKINQKSSCINKFQHGIIFKKKRTSFRQFRPFTSRFSGQDHAVFAIIIPHSEEM